MAKACLSFYVPSISISLSPIPVAAKDIRVRKINTHDFWIRRERLYVVRKVTYIQIFATKSGLFVWMLIDRPSCLSKVTLFRKWPSPIQTFISERVLLNNFLISAPNLV